MRVYRWILLSMILPLFTGCIQLAAYYDMDTDLIETSYEAADALVARLNPPFILDRTILVAGFADIDEMEQTSTFGRTVGEYIGSRLSQRGFQVAELKLYEPVFISVEEGIFILKNAVKEISLDKNAQALVVGTYSVADDLIYLSARVVNPINGMVLAAHAFKVPLGENNLRMIKTGKILPAPVPRRFPPGPIEREGKD